jgi:hypothetical protein
MLFWMTVGTLHAHYIISVHRGEMIDLKPDISHEAPRFWSLGGISSVADERGGSRGGRAVGLELYQQDNSININDSSALRVSTAHLRLSFPPLLMQEARHLTWQDHAVETKDLVSTAPMPALFWPS